MEQIKKLIEEFIGEYMPHINNECTYPYEEAEQQVFHKKLLNLLEAVAEDAYNQGDDDESRNAETYFEDYWQSIKQHLNT